MEPPGKKAKLERAETSANTDAICRFEAEGALEVHVADGTVMVHPALLGLVSPVFAAMLCTDMHEKHQQKLNLPGKTKDDLQLFLEFVRPLSRKYVDVGTVDRMLPWFDEYEVKGMKEECHALLLTLPVNSQRLLQADRYGLAKQYERCVKALSFQEYKTGFADLAAVPSVLQDVHRHLEKNQPSAKNFFAFVGNFIKKGVDLKEVLPLLLACLEHDGTIPVMGDVMPLLADLSKTSDPIQLAASMIKLLPSKDKINQAMAGLASEIDNEIPCSAKRRSNSERLDSWARAKIAAFYPF
jgi:hypothetical protein